MYMDKMKVTELKAEARKRKIKGFSKMKKAELLAALKGAEPEAKPDAKPEVKKYKQDKQNGVYFHSRMMENLIVANDDAVIPAGVKRRNHEAIEFMITKLDDKLRSMRKEVRDGKSEDRLNDSKVEKHIDKMTEDEVKKYYASFGFDVKPSTNRGVVDIKVVAPRDEEGTAAAKKKMEKYLSIQGIDLAYKVPFFSKIQINKKL